MRSINRQLRIIATAVFCLTTAQSVFAEEEACDEQQMDTVSLYYMTNTQAKESIAEYYQQQVETINELAKKYQWADYKLTSQDLSVSHSSYGSDALDVSVSISFQITANNKALDQLFANVKAYSISASRYSTGNCGSISSF